MRTRNLAARGPSVASVRRLFARAAAPRRLAALLSLPAVLLLAGGCSFARFDDLAEITPVVTVEGPDELSGGFGHVVATLRDDVSVHVAAMGSPGSVGGGRVELGFGESPAEGVSDADLCAGDVNPCAVGRTVAGLVKVPGVSGLDLPGCFAVGFGWPSANVDSAGVLVRCRDRTELAYPAPEAFRADLVAAVQTGNATRSTGAIAVDGSEDQAIAVGWEFGRRAWVHPPSADWALPASRDSIELPRPDDAGASFGRTVAVGQFANGDRFVAVGAPDQAQVWLYRVVSGSGDATPLGCRTGASGYGTALATGAVAGNASDELVIAGPSGGEVLDGAALASLSESEECGDLVDDGDVLGATTCAAAGDVENCAGFGASAAVGNLDADGDGEVVIGAPGATVKGAREAGAVFVFDVEGQSAPSDVLFSSGAEEFDRTGNSVAIAPIDARDVVVAGAPGKGAIRVLYCSALLPDALRSGSERCAR